MKRSALKWTLIGGALVFVLLYGIEMSTSGIERLYGSVDSSGEAANAALDRERESVSSLSPEEKLYKQYNDKLAELQERKIMLLEQELKELRKEAARIGQTEEYWGYPYSYERLPGLPAETEQASVDKLADSTSGMLQAASSSGIRFVVSLFDGLTK